MGRRWVDVKKKAYAQDRTLFMGWMNCTFYEINFPSFQISYLVYEANKTPDQSRKNYQHVNGEFPFRPLCRGNLASSLPCFTRKYQSKEKKTFLSSSVQETPAGA